MTQNKVYSFKKDKRTEDYWVFLISPTLFINTFITAAVEEYYVFIKIVKGFETKLGSVYYCNI